MTQEERRHGYRDRRVLIETERILNPQFDDAVVSLSGAQVELLRNITAYLDRETTFVSTYGDGYYLSPTVSDWDSLNAIVANLQEKLMGNINTPWGYKETLRERKQNLSAAAGDNTLVHTVVPEGEIWVVENITVWDSNTACTYVRVYVNSGISSYVVWHVPSPVNNVPDTYPYGFVLGEGDGVTVLFTGCVLNDDIYSDIIGYRMIVPA